MQVSSHLLAQRILSIKKTHGRAGKEQKHYPNFVFTPVLLRVQSTNKMIYILRYMTCCFNIHIHCEMIPAIKLMNTSIISVTIFFFIVTTLKMQSPSKFQVHNTVLWFTMVTVLYIRCPEGGRQPLGTIAWWGQWCWQQRVLEYLNIGFWAVRKRSGYLQVPWRASNSRRTSFPFWVGSPDW